MYGINRWMNSKFHKANILSSEFTTLGVRYPMVENDLDTKFDTYYWVQLFGGIKQAEPIKITLVQVSELAISSITFNKIVLKWNSQNTANADGFQVFKYNPSTNPLLS